MKMFARLTGQSFGDWAVNDRSDKVRTREARGWWGVAARAGAKNGAGRKEGQSSEGERGVEFC